MKSRFSKILAMAVPAMASFAIVMANVIAAMPCRGYLHEPEMPKSLMK